MKIFYKHNGLNNDSLIKEFNALKILQTTLERSNNHYLKTPKVIKVSKEELELEYIDSVPSNKEQMKDLGKGLAQLHSLKFENFGFKEDNFIGMSPQKNSFSKNWGEFFIEFRLFYQLEKIKSTSLKNEFKSILEKKAKSLSELLNCPNLHPSLVHGDLWSGNVMFTQNDIYLIDPSLHFAHREVDIAMTEMFGGFSNAFYDSYNQTLPLDKEYEIRKNFYNLYHYLNHYNLFGKSYLNSCIGLFERLERL